MRFLSTKQAAAQLLVSQRTIQRWLEEGQHFNPGEIYRAGSRYQVHPDAIDRLRKKFFDPL